MSVTGSLWRSLLSTKHFIESKFIRPKIRPYQTDNYYDILKRAAQAEKEVDRIVSAVQRKKK